MIFHYDISSLRPYINWVYFYHAWQLRDKDEQQRIRKEANLFLDDIASRYHTHAIVELYHCHSDGDDIVLDNGVRLPFLRQQTGNPCLCMADFIAPQPATRAKRYETVANTVALFATAADSGMEHDFDHDPYAKMMAQLLADRLAEATAERLHEEVRRRLWGYAADERLSIDDMLMERFQGIRPAVGYPSLPDASINFLIDSLLHFAKIGISLTESAAMRPHASVSGLMIGHPEARYFSVGKIGRDQLADYARRRGLPEHVMKKFLTSNL